MALTIRTLTKEASESLVYIQENINGCATASKAIDFSLGKFQYLNKSIEEKKERIKQLEAINGEQEKTIFLLMDFVNEVSEKILKEESNIFLFKEKIKQINKNIVIKKSYA